MRTTGTRFGAASLLVVAGLLAACSAAQARPGARSPAVGRPAAGHLGSTRAPVRAPAGTRGSARSPGGARLQISRGPWWQREPSPCAPPALVRAAGRVLGVGTCTGQLAIPGLKLTLAVGQRIDVHMLAAGVVPLPHSSRLAVLTPVAASQHGITQTYQAASPGHAELVSDAAGCFIFRHREGRETTRDCPVVTVTVVPELPGVPPAPAVVP